MSKMVKMDHFYPKSNIVELFSVSVYSVFLKLYLVTGIREWVKVPVLDF